MIDTCSQLLQQRGVRDWDPRAEDATTVCRQQDEGMGEATLREALDDYNSS